jgi:hypothetical protein
MVHLELVSEYGTISLDSVFNLGKGVEALSGATGFGLPPVDAQYTSGAGDGSQFRYLRYRERDIDIPFYLKGDNRDELKQIHRDVVRALTSRQTCTLRFVDDTESWVLDVKRVGGGDYIYGKDTTGDEDLTTIITVRAGDPFWRKEQHVAVDLAGEGGTFVFDNTGDAPAIPIVTLTGPGSDFVAISDTGETLVWNGVLQEEETMVIDFGAKTAIDDTGDNRYGDFAASPQFWQMLPGYRTLTFEWDNSSDEFLESIQALDFNYITNPTFHTNLTGWTNTTKKLFNAPTISASFSRTTGSINPEGYATISVPNKGYVGLMHTTVTGLTPGERYRVRVRYRWSLGKRAKAHKSPRLRVVGLKGVSGSMKGINVDRSLIIDFTATDTSHDIEFESGSTVAGSTTTRVWNTYCIEGTKNANYFSGDTADTAKYTYDWSGTAHNSKSFRLLNDPPDTSTTNINVEWAPRKLALV